MRENIKKQISVLEEISSKINGEQIYLVALFVYTVSCVLATTTFRNTNVICMLLGMMSLILLAIKVVVYDVYTYKEAVLPALMLAILLLILISTKNINVLGRILFIVCAVGVDYRKLLKTHLLAHFLTFLSAFIAQFMKVIENVQFDGRKSGRGIRNSFGIVYPTDLAAHIFYMMLTYSFLRQKKIKWKEIVFLYAINFLTYVYTNARVDSICMFVLITGMVILKANNEKKSNSIYQKYKTFKILTGIKVLSMPICAIVMLIFTYTYNSDVKLGENLEAEAYTLLQRFVLGKRMIEEKGINLFGQNIIWVGGGNKKNLPYNFVDCAYIKNAFDYGLIFAITIIILVAWMCYRHRDDKMFLLIMCVLAINNMIAHHMMEVSYNPYLLLLFSNYNFLSKTSRKLYCIEK